ncbi:MAG: phosphoglucosamine mutase [Theionarchaea archaeon]|nr:phosphoglucosamine mutase [Theionarchaea archaeon]MBU7037551.1 phosphoglucosamine mutase [Theionarchaea archaeon]
MRLFGTSGVRGVVNEEITTESTLNLGKAVGSSLPPDSQVCVATDPRLSRDMIKSSLTAGVLSAGVNVVDFGILPTPCLAFLTRELEMASGMMITASHNPPEFNGVKLWNPSTIGYSVEQEQYIERIYFDKAFRTAPWSSLGHMTKQENAHTHYFEAVKDKISVDTQLKVVVDPGNGAASGIASQLFEEMGISVLPINDVPDGRFPSRPSEPKEDTLKQTVQYLKDKKADLAVCFDGDADRVVFCDDRGFLGYNEMIAFISYLVVKESSRKVVATTVETGRLLDCAVGKAGGTVERGKVGDVHVAQLLKEKHACIGVEQVGVYVLPEIGMHPDSLYAALLLLEHIDHPHQIHQFIASLPTMYFAKSSIRCPNNRKEQLMSEVQSSLSQLSPENVSLLDGIRLEFTDSWLLIRPSGTEPVIRVLCESESLSAMETFLNEGNQIVEKALEKVDP